MAEGESRKFDDLKQEPVRPQPEEFAVREEEKDLSSLDIVEKDLDETPQTQTEPEIPPQINDEIFENDLNDEPDLADGIENLAETLIEPNLNEPSAEFLNNQQLADSDVFGPAAFRAGRKGHDEAHRMKGSGSGKSLDSLIEKETRKESGTEQRRRVLTDLMLIDMLNDQIAAIEAQIAELEEEIRQLEQRREELVEQREELAATAQNLEHISQDIDTNDQQLLQAQNALQQAQLSQQQLEDTMANTVSDFLIDGQINHAAIEQAIQEQNKHIRTLSESTKALEDNLTQMQEEAAAGNMTRDNNPDFYAKMDQAQAELEAMKNELNEQQTISQQMSALHTKLSSADYQAQARAAMADNILTQEELNKLGLPQNITPEMLAELRANGVSIHADSGAAARANELADMETARTTTAAIAQIQDINEAMKDLESEHDRLSGDLEAANTELDTSMQELQKMMADTKEANQLIGKWDTRHEYMKAHYSLKGWDETESIALVSRDESRILKDDEGHVVYYDPATQELFRLREGENGEKIRENYSDIDPAQIPALERQAWAEGEGNGKIFGNEALFGEGFADTYLAALGTTERSAHVSDSVVKQQNFVQALNGQIAAIEDKIKESQDLSKELTDKRDEVLKKLEELEANSENLSEEAKKELARQKAEIEQKIEEIDRELKENQEQIDTRREQVSELREELEELKSQRADLADGPSNEGNKNHISVANSMDTPGEPRGPNMRASWNNSAGQPHQPGDPTNVVNANRDASPDNTVPEQRVIASP